MKLLFLYGPVASGKLTVAREIAAQMGLPVFHNHLVVDAVAAVFPFGSEPFVRLREQFWLDMFREAAGVGRSLIFTFAPEPSVSAGFPEHVRRVVADAGGEVVFVRLTVPVAQQENRIANANRAEFGKLRSLDSLRQLRGQFTVCEAAMPAAVLSIDTGAVVPREAAQRIIAALAI